MPRDVNEKVERDLSQSELNTHLFPFPHSLTSAQHCPSSFLRPYHDHFTIISNFDSFSLVLQLLSTFSLHPNTPKRTVTAPIPAIPPSIDTFLPHHVQRFTPPCMAAPTQELPSWLSYSSSVLTDDAGNPTSTYTTVINLPLTYYGPSVSIWNFNRHLVFRRFDQVSLAPS